MRENWDKDMDLQKELQNIEAWEKEQKQVFFWEKLSRLPFMLLDKVTPKLIRDKLGDLLGEMGRFLQSGGQYLVQPKSVLKLLEQNRQQHSGTLAAGETIDEPQGGLTLEQARELPLAIMDRTVEELIRGRVKFAAVQGATTGVGGVFTLAADIPMVLGLSLKVLQEIAVCYGYDPRTEQERIFIVKCLQFASADVVGKKAVLEELALFEREDKELQVFSQIQGWREVVQTYRDSFGTKKLFQLIPVAGMIFGSISNKGTIEDVAEAGKMLYRKRRILARLNQKNMAMNDSDR
ncbi:EcsC family protein [Paenibacillus sp. FSL M7-1455]|uniref:EcsC family protein n=1 Tax=Paenibacillus sp. FSL M7-1455 TaxID=2975316 RepID=UPI0030F909BC